MYLEKHCQCLFLDSNFAMFKIKNLYFFLLLFNSNTEAVSCWGFKSHWQGWFLIKALTLLPARSLQIWILANHRNMKVRTSKAWYFRSFFFLFCFVLLLLFFFHQGICTWILLVACLVAAYLVKLTHMFPQVLCQVPVLSKVPVLMLDHSSSWWISTFPKSTSK